MQLLCYQHNVQQFFIRHIEKFNGVIVPLSIVASFPSGTYGFLRALLAKDRTKQFALDPRTPLFQHNWNRASLREPHRKMAAIFGDPFVSMGLVRPLVPEDLASPQAVKSITEAWIKFQLEFRVLKEEQRKLEKYRKLLGIDAMPDIKNPQRIVPPYFQFGAVGDPWYQVNLRCIEAASHIGDPNQITPVIHFTSWAGIADWAAIAKCISAAGIKSIFLYPNNFKEHEAADIDLERYLACVKTLTDAKLEILALHGGYFAILLGKKGLAGFGNGVGYGEWRDSGYHRGGTAEVRIYVPKLHRFLDPAIAQALVNRSGDYFTSDSDLLSEYALAKNPLTQVQSEEALDHFMECRNQEIEFVRENPIKALVAELNQTVGVLHDIGELEFERYGTSLNSWSNLLTK
jgi:hypothetical protein